MEHWRSLELKKRENEIKVLIIFKLGVVYIIMLKKYNNICFSGILKLWKKTT